MKRQRTPMPGPEFQKVPEVSMIWMIDHCVSPPTPTFTDTPPIPRFLLTAETLRIARRPQLGRLLKPADQGDYLPRVIYTGI